MKYALPLLLVTSAALAAARETPLDLGRLWPVASPAPVELHLDPPWLTGAWQEPAKGEAAVYPAAYHDADSHVGGVSADDPHAGLYADGPSGMGMCPRDGDGALDGTAHAEAEFAADPHAQLHAHKLAGAPVSAAGVTRSIAANGRTVAEIFAERTTLAERRVRVRGTVVKRTDGVLGKTYLHLRDGSGSPEHADYDLTVTTQDEFQIGETVEVEGSLLVDQDLGVGYHYAAVLDAASRVAPN